MIVHRGQHLDHLKQSGLDISQTFTASGLFKVFLVLALLGMVVQVIPFLNISMPSGVPPEISLPNLPPGLSENYGAKDALMAEKYNQPYIPSALIRISTLVLVLLALIGSGLSGKIEVKYGQGPNRWFARLAFFFSLYIVLYLSGMPCRVAGYFHSTEFGIITMGFWAWLGVLGIGLPVPLLLFIFKYTLVFCCMHIFGKRWWVAAAIAVFLIFHVVPEFMSNRPITLVRELNPLEEGPFRAQLEKVADLAGTRLDIFVEDRSKRSNAVNVYLGGRASNRYVVLTDTFLKTFSPQEAGVALAHELGHKNHEILSMAVRKGFGLFVLLAGFFLTSVIIGRKEIASRKGLQHVLIAVLCMICCGNLFRPVSNAISRWDETTSDRYCLELTRDAKNFKGLMLKMARINLEKIDLSRWEYHFFSGYPSVRERIEYADSFAFPPGIKYKQGG